MSPTQRKQAAKAATTAAKTLVANGGPKAIRALPKIAKSVRRTAASKGTPAAMRPKVLARTAAKVAQRPGLLRNLSRPSPKGQAIVQRAGNGSVRNITCPAAPRSRSASAEPTPARRRCHAGARCTPAATGGAPPPGSRPGRLGVRRFLAVKARGLKSRARRLVRLTPTSVGYRAEDLPFAPSPAHFRAANRRLAAIDRMVRRRVAELDATMAAGPAPQDGLLALAMVEREIDRARRAFGMFFEVFAQRGTAFAPALAAHDAIARDCYDAVAGQRAAPVPGPAAAADHLSRARLLAGHHAPRRDPVAAARRDQPVPADPHPLGSRPALAGGVPARGRAQSAGRPGPVGREPRTP